MKNIVICCDGTGNEIEEHQSNVLKLFRVLETGPEAETEQLAFYDTGVGVMSDSLNWAKFINKFSLVAGQAVGIGLERNVLDAYRFLIHNYEDGDKIWLFGYSRGAYTIRVLAGLLHAIGLLKPEHEHLASYAMTTYKRSEEDATDHRTWRFRRVMGLKRPPIWFMGCWDTVGSVIVPNLQKPLQELPHTKSNPSVQNFRHAMALDERRRMFRLYDWKEGQYCLTKSLDHIERLEDYFLETMHNPEIDGETDLWKKQTCRQVWFAGVHGDIGGGYPEAESGAAKLTLAWMVKEAERLGLCTNIDEVEKLVYGRMADPDDPDRTIADPHYRRPSATAALHDSMNFAWRVLEWLPKAIKPEWKGRGRFLGLYIPRHEPRPTDATPVFHISIKRRDNYGRWEDRTKDGRTRPIRFPGKPYAPPNLPEN
ncbi:MAG: DUF2235 domain-containing protein, partial [Pseudomonadota bacterium]